MDSVSHRVCHDVDSQRIGQFGGELLEEFAIFPLAFPTVANVVVLAHQGHGPPPIVKVPVEVR